MADVIPYLEWSKERRKTVVISTSVPKQPAFTSAFTHLQHVCFCTYRPRFSAAAVQSLENHKIQTKKKWSQWFNEVLLAFASLLRGTLHLQVLWKPCDEVWCIAEKLFYHALLSFPVFHPYPFLQVKSFLV